MDNKVYFYENHLGGGIYTSDEPINYEDLYCEECGDSDWEIGSADGFAEAWALFRSDCCWGYGYIYRILCEAYEIENKLEDEDDESKALNLIRQEVESEGGVWIVREAPAEMLKELPSLVTSVNMALGFCKDGTSHVDFNKMNISVETAEKYIKKCLKVEERVDYKGSKLRELKISGPAIVYVDGEFAFLSESGVYYASGNLSEREVMSIWRIK